MNRQRLDAESIRDAILAVSGKLDLTMGGPRFELFRFKDDHSPVYDYAAVRRRTTRQSTAGASTASSSGACRIRSWTGSTAPTRR